MRKQEDILHLETRRKIYNFISKNPGLHLHELSRRIDIPVTTLRYHLRYLINQNLVLSQREEELITYYKIDSYGINEKKFIKLLRKKNLRLILLIFYFELVTSRSQISEMLELDPNTVTYYLKKLLEFDIIEPAEIKNGGTYTKSGLKVIRTPIGREILFRLKVAFDHPDSLKILNLMIKHKKSFLDDLLDLYDLLEESYINDDKNEERAKYWKTLEDQLDSGIEALINIWQIPFCAGYQPWIKNKNKKKH